MSERINKYIPGETAIQFYIKLIQTRAFIQMRHTRRKEDIREGKERKGKKQRIKEKKGRERKRKDKDSILPDGN
jgi:hypothetical protein